MRLESNAAGHGPLVVLLHGMGGAAMQWSIVMKNMEASYHLVAVDLLGHGESPSPVDPAAYRRELSLEDIDEIVANYRVGDELPILVGHAFGGYLAMAYALERPELVSALVLIATGPGFVDPVSLVEWNTHTLDGSLRFDISAAACNLGVIPDSMVFDQLESIAPPALIIVGDQDESFLGASRVLDTRMPDSHLLVVPDAKHDILSTHSAMIGNEIQRFLSAGAIRP
ncbi:MAG: alpha/beta fold hydrolase [Acidimicrobiales bacterium]